MDHSSIDPAENLPHLPLDVPLWSESYAFWVWGEREGLSVYLHYQRHPERPSVWRALVAVMVDGKIYAANSYGPAFSPYGPGHAACFAKNEAPHRRWRLRTDSAAHVRTTEQLNLAAITDGPAIPMAIDLVYDCRSPVWFIGPATPGTNGVYTGHEEQTGWVTGTVTIGDKRYELDCLGANDHSHGSRDFANIADGTVYFICAFPSGRCLTAIKRAGKGMSGYLHIGDGQIRTARMIDADWPGSLTPGAKGELRIEAEGARARVSIELGERGLPITMVPPCFEHVGLVDGPATAQYCHEWGCEVTWDGEKGAGSWQLMRNAG